MKFGKVYNYKNAKKAEKLIGKKVLASDLLCEIENPTSYTLYTPYILVSVTEGITYPFRVASYNTSERFDYQFIREIIEASTKERKK